MLSCDLHDATVERCAFDMVCGGVWCFCISMQGLGLHMKMSASCDGEKGCAFFFFSHTCFQCAKNVVDSVVKGLYLPPISGKPTFQGLVSCQCRRATSTLQQLALLTVAPLYHCEDDPILTPSTSAPQIVGAVISKGLTFRAFHE